MEWLNCHESNPLRPVEWRWRRAEIMHARGPAFKPKGIDDWTRRALKFKTRLERCSNEAQRGKLGEEMPELYWAYHLWLQDHHPLHWELEARLLTTMPFEGIAAIFGVPVATIEAYEALFYDVRSYLEASGYIHQAAIGGVLHEGLSPRQVDVVWKLYAYHGGSVVLDALIAPVLERVDDQKCPDVAWNLVESSRRLLGMKASIAAWLTPVTEKTAPGLIKLYYRETSEKKGKRVKDVEAEQVRDRQLRDGLKGLFESLKHLWGPPLDPGLAIQAGRIDLGESADDGTPGPGGPAED